MYKFQLSKSTFLRSLKCAKCLYLNKHHKELRGDTSESQQAVFDQGSWVGELACDLFPGGVDLTPEDFSDFAPNLARTAEEMQKENTVLYEAGFAHEGVLCLGDIIVKKGGRTLAYEVKSSTSVKEVYVQDAALQYYVMDKCGHTPADFFIVYINNQYMRLGDTDINQLFVVESVLTEVKALQPKMPGWLDAARQVLTGGEVPVKDIGPWCFDPYACDFIDHCWKHIPEVSVFNISRLSTDKKFDLYNQEIVALEDVPEDYPLNENQRLQVDCYKTQETFINEEQIRTFLDGLQYPLYFLDFETFGAAVPLVDHSRPYQQVVFQYSLHVQDAPHGEVKHYEYLAPTDGSDPRDGFIENLLKDCGLSGDVLVYNVGFERGKLEDLKGAYPGKATRINDLIARLKDLMVPFQNKWYYTPEMNGSYSIKKVLPALVPELSYEHLEIGDGATASQVFANMMAGAFEGDMEKTRIDLLKYCEMDTWAMVRILEKLHTV